MPAVIADVTVGHASTQNKTCVFTQARVPGKL